MLTNSLTLYEKGEGVKFYKCHFDDFYSSQPAKVRDKIDEVLYMVSVADRIPIRFFKHIESAKGLYEIRVEYGGNIYRIFCYFDEGQVIILFNGFQKKSQKTPCGEIERALRIKEAYFSEK